MGTGLDAGVDAPYWCSSVGRCTKIDHAFLSMAHSDFVKYQLNQRIISAVCEIFFWAALEKKI